MTTRVSTGYSKLDEMLGGGLLPGTLTVVYGATGIGKTHLGLGFCAHGARADRARGIVFDMNVRGDSQQHHAYAARLHDWDLKEKKQLIRAAWEALPPGGAFIAYDAIIDDSRRENAFGLLMSLNMLIETPGGFDYSGADCIGWMKEAGFRDCYVQHLVGPDSMVVGFK